jgi:hypothetical protein
LFSWIVWEMKEIDVIFDLKEFVFMDSVGNERN